jgi:hypothetical protein
MRKKWFRIILIGLIVVFGAFCILRYLSQKASPVGVLFPRMANQEGITPMPTPTDLPPTPTETLPPTQELPTPEQHLPALEPWTGAPTYAAESTPGYYFRVDFDPTLWALTEDEFGNTALVHRNIAYCKMIPTSGRGTPRGWTVEDQIRDVGAIRYDVVTVNQNGVVQFVNYFTFNGNVPTGFQVSAQDRQQECFRSAETVLETLSSVIAPTPTLTPTATIIP